MPMPVLDPRRYVQAELADRSHRLPMPDRGMRLFSQSGPETVDIFDPFYAALLADGSIRRVMPVDGAPSGASGATSASAAAGSASTAPVATGATAGTAATGVAPSAAGTAGAASTAPPPSA